MFTIFGNLESEIFCLANLVYRKEFCRAAGGEFKCLRHTQIDRTQRAIEDFRYRRFELGGGVGGGGGGGGWRGVGEMGSGSDNGGGVGDNVGCNDG